MINVARYVHACTQGAHVNLARLRSVVGRRKINNCNMKLLNYVRVESDCVIVCSNMHVEHGLISFKLIGASRTTHRLLMFYYRLHDAGFMIRAEVFLTLKCKKEKKFFQLKKRLSRGRCN